MYQYVKDDQGPLITCTLLLVAMLSRKKNTCLLCEFLSLTTDNINLPILRDKAYLNECTKKIDIASHYTLFSHHFVKMTLDDSLSSSSSSNLSAVLYGPQDLRLVSCRSSTCNPLDIYSVVSIQEHQLMDDPKAGGTVSTHS